MRPISIWCKCATRRRRWSTQSSRTMRSAASRHRPPSARCFLTSSRIVAMRPWLLVVFAVALLSPPAMAQRKPPPKLEPLPEPPPPPAMPVDEPSVRIPLQEGDKIEEVRQGGRVVAVRVTPPNGRPYYLVDTTGNGNWMRRDSLDDGVRVPMWPIHTFD